MSWWRFCSEGGVLFGAVDGFVSCGCVRIMFGGQCREDSSRVD